MGSIIGGVLDQITETGDYASTSSNADVQLVTATVTQGENTSATPTATFETSLITSPPTVASSSITVVFVYSSSIIASSSSSSSSSSGQQVSSLSPGVIAGIVIGSLAFLIGLITIVFCASRRFARKKRRETPLHMANASRAPSYHQAKPVRPRDPAQELATQYNQLEIGGRGRPFEVAGSYLHPVELQASSMTDLAAYPWKGSPPGWGVSPPYIMGDDIFGCRVWGYASRAFYYDITCVVLGSLSMKLEE
ncbi:hypothetical protein VSDG_01432 [Cytospora chrysosperma]|uniref:Mid2 domain-containing protein n=1 Tax=Cytospora chrysosperma TaxID=252740 RepID=A0A423WJ11_CYTCH|nr:hypothetical protein VSDG_01432 [Valsa sordida]